MLELLKSNAKSKNIVAELFVNLGINAKVLATQIINFAVLLLILQKFAYKPVVGMLEKRREEVERANKHASELEERDKLREDLRKEIGETVASAIERSVGDVLDKGAKEKLLSQALEKTKQ